jgi:glucosyl-3-phosphoglycerate synthase
VTTTPEDLTSATRVETGGSGTGAVADWFERRTSSVRDWSFAEGRARKGGTTVSVVLPALDEEATVGAIVSAIRRDLVDRVGLVDELVVLDSGSTDATAAVAAAAGARVEHSHAVLPRLGAVPGKGEALWKALHVTHGDVVVYVDSDLTDFDASFVVGLLGPLVHDPAVAMVKAFYDRPLTTSEGVAPAGGGRVTELVARPLLNACWPQLAGVVQPLAGEYAARRDLLVRLPFVSGYGVEVGMLVDLLDLVGLDGLAQVDLGVRSHRHQSDEALGRMAGQLWQTLIRRLPATPTTADGEPVSAVLTQFVRDQHGRYGMRTRDVSTTERPPMLTVPEYRARHGLARSGT